MFFLCTADWQITHKTPIARTDDYIQAIYEKVKWVFNIAKKNNAIILHGGDVFDLPKWGMLICIKMLLLCYLPGKVSLLSPIQALPLL